MKSRIWGFFVGYLPYHIEDEKERYGLCNYDVISLLTLIEIYIQLYLKIAEAVTLGIFGLSLLLFTGMNVSWNKKW